MQGTTNLSQLAIDAKVSKAGDTMSGMLVIGASATDTQLKAEKSHTETTSRESIIAIGNNVANGTSGCTRGVLRIFGDGTYRTDLKASDSTANRTISFPDADGTVALKDVNNAFTADQTINKQTGTTSALGYSRLTLGNNKGAGVTGNSTGVLGIYGQTGNMIELFDKVGVTAYRSFGFPDASGTFALQEDTTYLGENITEKSIPSSSTTYTTVVSKSFSPGMYIVILTGYFATTSATGARILAFKVTNGATTYVDVRPGVADSWDYMQLVKIFNVSSTTTIDFYAQQTSGSSVSFAGNFQYVKVK